MNPGADIATGFEFATLQLKDGSTVVCIIRRESPAALQVEVARAGAMKQREVLKADVQQHTYLMTPGTRPSLEQSEFCQSVLARIPVGRVGSIHDIAHAVRFLCHPDSGLITGEVLMVDGGWTLA